MPNDDQMRRWVEERAVGGEEGAPVHFNADQAYGHSCGQAAAYRAVLEFLQANTAPEASQDEKDAGRKDGINLALKEIDYAIEDGHCAEWVATKIRALI